MSGGPSFWSPVPRERQLWAQGASSLSPEAASSADPARPQNASLQHPLCAEGQRESCAAPPVTRVTVAVHRG